MLVHLMGHQQLTTEMVLEIMLVISMLRMPLLYISYGVSTFFQMEVLMDRIAQIFNSEHQEYQDEEQKGKDEEKAHDIENAVEIHNLSFSYQNSSEEKSILESIDLKLTLGDFAVVIGDVGSGKTTLLDCIASQLDTSDGEIICHHGISYMEQEPIVFMGNIRDNITLDSEMN